MLLKKDTMTVNCFLKKGKIHAPVVQKILYIKLASIYNYQ